MVAVHEEASEPLLGRGTELARLHQLLDEARSGVSALVLTGEPGIGKSSLVRACVETATALGAQVLQASGVEFETEVGYAALHELLLPHRDVFAALDQRHQQALDACLGLSAGPPPSLSTVASATLALLRRLTAGGLVLLAVDDVHWLDRPSAAVLSTVTHAMAGDGVAIVFVLREGEDSFLEHGTIPHVRVPPLSSAAAAELLQRRAPGLGPAARERLLEQAEGNPLALLQLPLDQAVAPNSWHGAPVLPHRLRELFAPRIAELPPSTREFLLLAALDTSTDLGIILAAGKDRVSEADVRSSAARELVRVDPRTNTVRFSHPLVRSTVVGLAAPADRRAAHRLLGEAEPQVERRARHQADALVAPSEPVATLLESSAQVLLRRGDPLGAVTTLLRAADVSEDAPQRSRRLAYAAYVGAHATGDLRKVAGLLSEARASGSDGSASLPWAVAAAYALLNADGDLAAAHRILVGALTSGRQVRESSAEPPSDALQTLLAICFFAGREDLWRPFFEQLDQLQAPLPVALRLCVQTFAQPARRGARAIEELRAVIAGLPAEIDPNQVVLVGRAAFYVDQLEGCRPALLRVTSQARHNGAVTPAIEAYMLLAFQAFLDGQWAAAGHYTREGLALCEERGYQLLAWPGRYCLALVAAATGDDPLSTRLSDEMLVWAQPRGVRSVSAYAHHVKALAALGRSDFETAFRHASAVSPPGVLDAALAHALWLTMDLVEAAVHSDHLAEAVAHVEAMRACDLGTLSSRYALMLAGAEAMVGDDLTLFDRALAVPGADRWPFELARVQLAHGARLHRARRHTRARTQLNAALDAFVLLRATPWVERARSELDASSGQRGPSQGPGPVPAITPRELEVARLAASGMTNSQIARRLDTSARTVSAHLGHVLAKLGLTSRAGLRDALSRQDDTGG